MNPKFHKMKLAQDSCDRNAVFFTCMARNSSERLCAINLMHSNKGSFYNRNFMAKIQQNSIDIYLNKPQSIRIIKIGFDYILSIFIICWLSLNFGLNSFCSHHRSHCVYYVSSAHFCHSKSTSIHFVFAIKLFVCVHVCVGHFYPNRQIVYMRILMYSISKILTHFSQGVISISGALLCDYGFGECVCVFSLLPNI